MSHRLDRAITLNIAQPCRRMLGWLRNRNFHFSTTCHAEAAERRIIQRLPILMYHSISDSIELGVAPYYRTVTTPERFAEQMHFLKENGYQAVTLREGLEWLKSVSLANGAALTLNPQLSTLNSKCVALTFDDGFRDFYTAAAPLLKKLDFGATVYLPTAFIGVTRRQFCPSTTGRAEPWQRRINSVKERGSHGALRSQPSTYSDCLSWLEVRELHSAGVEFGSHTLNHPKLIDLSWTEIKAELSDSKSEIENHLGSPVTSFAYPYAFPQANDDFSGRFREMLTTVGYESCVTTEIGCVTAADDPLRLKRIPVNGDDDVDLFAAKLHGAYDWLAWPQKMIKRGKQELTSLRNRARFATNPLRSG